MVDEKITHTSNRLRDETNIVDVPWPNFGPRARFTLSSGVTDSRYQLPLPNFPKSRITVRGKKLKSDLLKLRQCDKGVSW